MLLVIILASLLFVPGRRGACKSSIHLELPHAGRSGRSGRVGVVPCGRLIHQRRTDGLMYRRRNVDRWHAVTERTREVERRSGWALSTTPRHCTRLNACWPWHHLGGLYRQTDGPRQSVLASPRWHAQRPRRWRRILLLLLLLLLGVSQLLPTFSCPWLDPEFRVNLVKLEFSTPGTN